IPMGTFQLKTRTDWPNWYIQFTWHAKLRDVWELVNPDAPDAPGMHEGAPELPLMSSGVEFGAAEQQAFSSTYENRPPAHSTRSHPEAYTQELAKYKVRSSEWAAKAERLQKLWNWVNATVAPAIISPVIVRLVSSNSTTLQSLIRALKQELAPTSLSTKNQVRAEYRAHLGAAKQGRAAPHDWYQKWSYLYMSAKAYDLAEVDRELAVQDFLDALSY
ncbi:uncharacterized protein M421DRAFT_69805, partial [Didymella exigua CBS 183.55]